MKDNKQASSSISRLTDLGLFTKSAAEIVNLTPEMMNPLTTGLRAGTFGAAGSIYNDLNRAGYKASLPRLLGEDLLAALAGSTAGVGLTALARGGKITGGQALLASLLGSSLGSGLHGGHVALRRNESLRRTRRNSDLAGGGLGALAGGAVGSMLSQDSPLLGTALGAILGAGAGVGGSKLLHALT